MSDEPKFRSPAARNMARRIRRMRGDLTQEEFAARTGFAQGLISHWERGLKIPSLPSLIQLRERLGITPDEFVELVEIAGEKRGAA